MDFRRVLLFFALSLLCIYAYGELMGRFYGRRPSGERRSEVEIVREPEPVPDAPGTTVPPASPPEVRTTPETAPLPAGKTVVVETDLFRTEWTTTGARLEHVLLKDYRSAADTESPPLDVVGAPSGALPVGLEIPGLSLRDDRMVYTVDRETLRLTGDETGGVLFRGQSSEGVQIEKEVTFKGNAYPMQVSVRVRGADPAAVARGVVLLTSSVDEHAGGGGWFGGSSRVNKSRGVIALDGKRLEQGTFAGLTEEALEFETPLWAGFADRYFLEVALPGNASAARVTAPLRTQGEPAVVRIDLPLEGTPPEAKLSLYYGPKQLAELERADPALERAVDFGIFWFVALPLYWAIRTFHRLSGNYGVDIVVVSTVIKLVFLPLTRKSMESMRAMQKLQPEMTKIRERYSDDAQRVQKEMMELYRRHHVNPLSGCLPMLLQIPVFVGLYNTLLNAIELRHAPFVFWITDLSAPERLSIAGVQVPMLAIAMGASMLLQQWMAPATGDPAQRRIMMIMPVMFTFMFINFPSGLVLYWLVNNVLGVAQQWWVIRQTERAQAAKA